VIGYDSKTETVENQMRSLTGAFAIEEGPEPVNTKTILYPFAIQYPKERLKFYAYKKEEQTKWLMAIKSAIGYLSLSEYYEVKVRFMIKIFFRNHWVKESLES
jgi:hypothetical protein